MSTVCAAARAVVAVCACGVSLACPHAVVAQAFRKPVEAMNVSTGDTDTSRTRSDGRSALARRLRDDRRA